MPEGPEVRIFAEGLSLIIGLTITDIYYKEKCSDKFKVFEIGDTILDIYSHGKKIIFKIERNNEEICIMNSPLMGGRWIYEGESYDFELFFHDQSIESVKYHNSCKFSSFDIGLESKLLKDVGPDWLKGVTYEEFYKKITNTRIKSMEICNFLLKQNYFSGVGNYLKCEILFETRLHPQQPIGTLDENLIFELYETIVRTINNAYKLGGLTIKTYFDPFGNKGLFETKVYGKDFVTHYSERYPVKSDKFSDGRTTHYVPALQMLY